MKPDELYEIVIKDQPEQLAARIVNFIFHDEWQNHLFFEDYERIFRESDLKVLLFAGYHDPKAEDIYAPDNMPDIHEKLRNKYPSNRNFFNQGIFSVMRKPLS